jgi:hypothetical protein
MAFTRVFLLEFPRSKVSLGRIQALVLWRKRLFYGRSIWQCFLCLISSSNHRLKEWNNLLILTLIILNHRQKLPKLNFPRVILIHRIDKGLNFLPGLKQPNWKQQFFKFIYSNRSSFLLIQRIKIPLHLLPLLIVEINQIFPPLFYQPLSLLELPQIVFMIPHLLLPPRLPPLPAQ